MAKRDFRLCSWWSLRYKSAFGGPVLWFANGAPTPRRATTVPVDAICGGNICFDFRMETQGGTAGCDGPDLANEGVYLEYRVAGGNGLKFFIFLQSDFHIQDGKTIVFPFLLLLKLLPLNLDGPKLQLLDPHGIFGELTMLIFQLVQVTQQFGMVVQLQAIPLIQLL